MKSIIAVVLLAANLLVANAEPSCFKTKNSGASTVELGIYTAPCATISYSSGIVTKDVKYTCCGTSYWVRVNYADWTKLLNDGKLDGLRYQKPDLTFRKIVNKKLTTISAEQYLP
ncbi:hypothetical protein G6F70_006777 [Rhizopus microsporus]|uniref:Uncharacterized protein n=1 Tax=Rhizopus azygosporus TaxID=86630 RepID=A0A367JWZ2_RHIAZ|nr:hypothetical protein G6F71_006760 [Rhizopus microsporus]RCH94450.1 hypothetical protein CU097_013491 [Rhizopus azygosporus]KAG1197243.1 hypothetical protein G6F70_006777 [Rhizopus microsporus]KAG1209067.1 hypothetical protein G6F69_006687 [Rhizopus microsporus]KAG1230431.1 hypothetical protein G6F67_006458 [Rhizopus microsporus]